MMASEAIDRILDMLGKGKNTLTIEFSRSNGSVEVRLIDRSGDFAFVRDTTTRAALTATWQKLEQFVEEYQANLEGTAPQTIDHETCQHAETIGNATRGYFCTRCGVKVMQAETRQCGQCRSFQYGAGPYCIKRGIVISPEMRAVYKVQDGTCFELPDERDEKPEFPAYTDSQDREHAEY